MSAALPVLPPKNGGWVLWCVCHGEVTAVVGPCGVGRERLPPLKPTVGVSGCCGKDRTTGTFGPVVSSSFFTRVQPPVVTKTRTPSPHPRTHNLFSVASQPISPTVPRPSGAQILLVVSGYPSPAGLANPSNPLGGWVGPKVDSEILGPPFFVFYSTFLPLPSPTFSVVLSSPTTRNLLHPLGLPFPTCPLTS